MPQVLNPNSAMMKQSEGFWQKYVALLLFKLSPRESVTITFEDMQRFEKFYANNIVIHDHPDSIEFKLVDDATAIRLAEYDAKQNSPTRKN